MWMVPLGVHGWVLAGWVLWLLAQRVLVLVAVQVSGALTCSLPAHLPARPAIGATRTCFRPLEKAGAGRVASAQQEQDDAGQEGVTAHFPSLWGSPWGHFPPSTANPACLRDLQDPLG